MACDKIFISFDYDQDLNYKNLMVAWDANDRFDFSFNDHSVTDPIDSEKTAYVRQVIKEKMAKADCLLCLVGEKTSLSDWVNWEVKTAKELGLNLVAVKIDPSYESPSELLNSGANWAKSFTYSSIVQAIS